MLAHPARARAGRRRLPRSGPARRGRQRRHGRHQRRAGRGAHRPHPPGGRARPVRPARAARGRAGLRRGESVVDVTLVGETPAAPGRLREWRASFHPVGQPAIRPTTGRQSATVHPGLEVSADARPRSSAGGCRRCWPGSGPASTRWCSSCRSGSRSSPSVPDASSCTTRPPSRITGISSGPVGEVLARLPTSAGRHAAALGGAPVVRAIETGRR